MKEIGEKFKETRESMGISVEEAAEDLKIRPAQLENIEEGNKEAFDDIFYLKFFIRDYAKYLGLDYEELVDEFNEYLFDYTSRLSLDDIKNATSKEEKPKKIQSPYTIEKKQHRSIPPVLIYILVAFTIAIIVYFLVLIAVDISKDKNGEVAKNLVEEKYEFA